MSSNRAERFRGKGWVSFFSKMGLKMVDMDQQQMEGTKNKRNGPKHSLRGDFFNVVFDGRTPKMLRYALNHTMDGTTNKNGFVEV